MCPNTRHRRSTVYSLQMTNPEQSYSSLPSKPYITKHRKRRSLNTPGLPFGQHREVRADDAAGQERLQVVTKQDAKRSCKNKAFPSQLAGITETPGPGLPLGA